MTAISDAAIRRFESWADYNSAVDTEFRFDPGRQPWPVEYDAAGAGIDNDRWARPEQVRILFLPHGFALDGSRDDELGNLVACGMAWEPPVTLLAERARFAVAESLLVKRPAPSNESSRCCAMPPATGPPCTPRTAVMPARKEAGPVSTTRMENQPVPDMVRQTGQA